MDGSASNRRTGEVRRAEIAEAALRCLIAHGYAGMTARKVAAEAGISLGHLTYHFATMDDVQTAAYARVAEMLGDTGPSGAVGQSPSERLEAYLHAVFAPPHAAPERLRLRVDLWSAAMGNPAVATIEAGLQRAQRSKVEDLLNAVSDPWKTARVPMVADVICAAIDGLWLSAAREAGGDGTSSTAPAIEALVLFAKMRLGGS